jgi:predicted molibdopterin-dependent oxidoreductase YjgC
VRVDRYLEAGVSEVDADRWVQTASILHSNGDALDIAVKDGRIVVVRGRSVDRVNKGGLDPKDLFGWQANNSEDRLRRPLVRRDGELVEASWDEAFDLIVGRSLCSRRRDRWRSGSTLRDSSSSRSTIPWA